MKSSPPSLPSTSVNKRLVAYSAMASAALMLAAQGETYAYVSYTDIDPDSNIVLGDQIVRLDFDGDGEIDFKFGVNAFNDTFDSGSLAGQTFYFNGAFVFGEDGNSFAGAKLEVDINTYFLPYVYEFGEYIGWGANWQASEALGSLNYFIDPEDFEGTSGGNWINRADGYLGVRFLIEDNSYFGWIRLDVGQPDGGNIIVLKDYAFEDVPWNGILAGGTVGGVTPTGFPEPELIDYEVYSFSNSIYLHCAGNAAFQSAEVLVSDVFGRIAADFQMNERFKEITGLPEGIYIVKIRNDEGILTRRLYVGR